MNINHYSRETGEFLYSSLAILDPVDNQPLIPAYTTNKPLPTLTANHAAVFNGIKWMVVDDYRGYVGYDAQAVEHKIDQLNIAPDSTWTATKPFILSAAKALKKAEIRAAFSVAEQLPATDANGITWSGGYDSAIKLDAAKRIAQMSGQANVAFFDTANAAHILTISEAEAVILQLGADFQGKFAAKQALMVQVDNLAITATQADLDAITILI